MVLYSVSRAQGEEGIEIMRQKGPSNTSATLSKKKRKRSNENQQPALDMVVHPRYTHFLHMVWFIGRIDHVLRSIVRCWQFKCGSSSMSCSVDSCHKFLEENSSEISSLGTMFAHAILHTKNSLEVLQNSSKKRMG